MKNRRALNFVLAAALLSMTVLTVDMPLIRALEWSPETQLTTDPNQDKSPSIMQALNDTIWVVWMSNRMGVLNYELFYKTSSNYGLDWSLDTRLTEASGYNSNPSIMQASNGLIWVVWASDRTGKNLFYKTSPNNGASWSSDTQLTTDPNLDANPSIMQATNGTIWVVWYSNRTGNSELFYKTFNGTAWSSDTRLTNDSAFNHMAPSIAQDRRGTIWVVWHSVDVIDPAIIDLYYKVYSGSAWSSDRQLTIDPDPENPVSDMTPSIAQINDGKIWIVWAADRDEDFDLYYKIVQVKITGDINGDGTVDIYDVPLMVNDVDAIPSSLNWNNGRSDFNDDKRVDVLDITIFSTNYGRTE